MPDPKPPIRKPSHSLNRKDFETNPIWKYVLDGDASGIDESYVSPAPCQVIAFAEFEQYLVSATAILKDGTELPACVEVSMQNKRLKFIPLFVFLLDRQLDFVSNETDRLLSRYTKTLGNRPVRWKLIPLVEGENRERTGQVHRTLLYLFLSFALKVTKSKWFNRDK